MAIDLLSCIKGFSAVAACKGFSPAARQLRISTPVLTKQIQMLEHKLGKKLLERTTRYVALTEAGATYLAHANKILAELENAKQSISNLETEPHGHLTIGIPGCFETPQFIEYMHAFLDRYPKITIDTRNENAPTLLLDQALDLAISECNFNDKQLIKEYVFTLHRSVYAAPSYLKKHGTPKTLADLKNHNCLVYKKVSPDHLWLFGKNKKVTVNGNYTSNSGLNLLLALQGGLGLLWGSGIMIQNELKSKKLVEVKLDHPPFASKVYLYYRPTSMNRNVKLMVEYIKQFRLDP